MRKNILAIAAAALLGSVSLASATTMTAPDIKSHSATTNWGYSSALGLTGTPISLSFDGFTGTGILTGVIINVTENANGTVTNTNTNSDPNSDPTHVESYIINSWRVYLPTSLGGVTFLGSSTFTDLGVDDPLNPGATGDAHAVTGTSNATATSGPGDNLGFFLSPFDISIADKGSVAVSSDNGNGQSAYTDSGQIMVSVTYVYDDIPTPEPATLALFGSSLFGLGLIRRRRV